MQIFDTFFWVISPFVLAFISGHFNYGTWFQWSRFERLVRAVVLFTAACLFLLAVVSFDGMYGTLSQGIPLREEMAGGGKLWLVRHMILVLFLVCFALGTWHGRWYFTLSREEQKLAPPPAPETEKVSAR